MRFDLLALHRRAFVQIAQTIIDGSPATPSWHRQAKLAAVRLTSMLIKTDAPSTATRPAATAPSTNRQSLTEVAPPRTFAEGAAASAGPIANTSKRDEAVQATSANRAGVGYKVDFQEGAIAVGCPEISRRTRSIQI